MGLNKLKNRSHIFKHGQGTCEIKKCFDVTQISKFDLTLASAMCSSNICTTKRFLYSYKIHFIGDNIEIDCVLTL
jgi:hypothetical protein